MRTSQVCHIEHVEARTQHDTGPHAGVVQITGKTANDIEVGSALVCAFVESAAA